MTNDEASKTKEYIREAIRSYLEQEDKSGGIYYRRIDDFVDGRIAIGAIANIVIEHCARICDHAGYDDHGACARELREVIRG